MLRRQMQHLQMWKKFFNILLISLLSFSSTNCQNTKNMDNEFLYLIKLIDKPEYRNKYLFVDNYIPSIMLRKGFDYVDAHQTSLATADFFLFENKAINRYENSPLINNVSYFRCLYINDRGQIAHTIKRKITVKKLHSDEQNIELASIPKGINRFYGEQIITSEQLFSKLTSTEEFIYIHFKKTEDNNIIYEITISNNVTTDIIYNSQGEKLYSNVSFCKAEFIYNQKNDFIDLKIIK